MAIKKLDETAQAGTISSTAIAANYDRPTGVISREKGTETNWHHEVSDRKTPEGQRKLDARARAKKNLEAAKEKLKKKKGLVHGFKHFLGVTNESAFEAALLEIKPKTMFKINENFNMQDVVSRLKGIQHTSTPNPTVSYGVQDDSGNLMKITVKAEDSKDFEAKLGAELADAQDYKKVTGQSRELSMAELLFKLKDQFDIVDVEFPTIPKDAVYNADKVSYGNDTGNPEDMGGENGMGGPETGEGMPEDQMGQPPLGGELGAAGEGGEPNPLDTLGGEGGEENPEMADDGSVEEFPPETGETDEKSLLVSILGMLKADAEAKKAQADAEAEKYRAQQAQYSKEAASTELSRQEEMARLEATMDQQKQKEKEAKKMADLAKFRVNSASSMGESKKTSFGTYLLEFADGFTDNMAALAKEKQALRQQYAPVQGDDPDTVQFKRNSLMFATKEIDAKIKLAQLAAAYKQKRQAQQGNPQQNQQQQNPAQPNQPVTPQPPNPNAPGTNTQPAGTNQQAAQNGQQNNQQVRQ